ncbi:hypothetical protein [uncultured Roseobacter sp.]|uniref:hypothetical protein n=1 Tax=uncultured Roseobacter sp. TaxID=114847 RepID=UPI00261BAF5B|nr:hypothetical protein [uncultured Roseobacter sp.]
MNKPVLKAAMFVFAAFVLSACAQGPKDPQTAKILDTGDLPKQKFVVGGYSSDRNAPPKPVGDLTDQEFQTLLMALDSRQCKKNDSVEKCAERIERANLKKLSNGVSGITGRALLRAAQGGKNANDKREVLVRGQILEYCEHDKSLPGYHYDKNTGHLRLCVIMETEIVKSKNANNRIRYQYFHVEAKKARVDTKNTSDPANVFPAAAAATGLKVNATTAANFNYKLYAAGKNIEVKQYWEANAKNKQANPAWKKYVKGQPGIPKRIADYFETDHDGCIDMMFPLPSVPETLPPGAAGGIHYCLGRCENPPIVNTR